MFGRHSERTRALTGLLLLLPGCEVDGSGGSPPLPGPGNATGAVVTWQLTEDLLQPDSAFHHDGSIYISQMRGSATQLDGDGWVSRLSPNGDSFEPRWARGLHAPKGMRAHGGTLWVADVYRLVPISLADGSWSERDAIEVGPAADSASGKLLLNDVAVGPDGRIYVSDTLGNRVYRIDPRRAQDDRVSVYAPAFNWDHPNGLLIQNGTLLAASWGVPENASTFGLTSATTQKGRVIAVDLASGQQIFRTAPLGNLDGIESDAHGGLLLTDWMNGTLLHLDPDQKRVGLANFPQGAADLAYLPERNQAIIPLTTQNRVVSQPALVHALE